MKKVITTMLVAAMVLSMAVPTSAATITRKKSTGTTASTTKVSGDYSLKMVDKTLQFIRGGKVVSSIETKDGKITLRKSSAGGISVVFTDANGKRRNITLGKQNSVALSGTFVQVSVDKALGSSFEVEMEKGSKVTNFYAKGAAKVTLNGSVTTLNVTSSNANVAANGTVSRAYAVNKKAITGMSSGKITQTSTGTSASGSVNTSTGSSSSSNTTVNSGSGSSGSSSSGGSSGIIINGGGSNGGTNTVAAPKITQQPTNVEIEEGKTATLTIKATGTGKVSYQWYDAKTGKAITGATSNTLNVKPTETSSYYCMVTNTVGSKKATIRSITVTVTVKGQVVVVAAPVITTEPADVTVEVGNPATLKVEVKAVAGLTPKYQWYTTNNDGATPVNTAIKDATDATYTVTPDVAGVTSYYCTIINENKDGVKSEPATSKTASITATAKVDDTDLKAAKAAVEALMNKEYPDMTTLENAIKEAAGTTVKPEIKLTEGEDGKVTGTVTLTKDGVKDPVVINFTATIKAEPTENADLKAAKDAIEALNTNSYADAAAAIKAIKDAVTNTAIDVNTDDVKENADKTRIVGDVVLTITVDGKPVTATAKFDAAVTQQGEDAKAGAVSVTIALGDPAKTSFVEGDQDAYIEATATVDTATGAQGELTYQWYVGTTSGFGAQDMKAIPGATSAKYELKKMNQVADDGSYYFCEVVNTVTAADKTKDSQKNHSAASKYISVAYPEGAAETPVVTKVAFADAEYTQDATSTVTPLELNVGSVTSDTAKLSYQWYRATSESAEGVALEGTGASGELPKTGGSISYKPKVTKNEAGTSYYYCIVTNTDEGATTTNPAYKTVSVKSDVVKIVVNSTLTFVVVPDGTASTKDTTKLTVSFTDGSAIAGMANSFKVVDKTIASGATSVMSVASVDEVRGGKEYTINLKGKVPKEGHEVVVSVENLPEGISFSTSSAVVALHKNTSVKDAVNLVSIAPVAGENGGAEGTSDTKEVLVTFEGPVTKSSGTDLDDGDFTITGATVDSATPNADNSAYTLEITLTNPSVATKTEELAFTMSGSYDQDVTIPANTKVTTNRDITAPTLHTPVLSEDRETITIACSEDVAVEGTLTSLDFAVASTDNTYDGTVSTVAFANNTVTLTLSKPFTNGKSGIVTYTEDATNYLRDKSVNENKMKTQEKKFGTDTDVASAKAESISFTGDTKVNVNFDKAVSQGASGADLEKLFTVNGTNPTGARITGKTVELTVSKLNAGASVKVIYTPATDEAKLKDNLVAVANGAEVAAFEKEATYVSTISTIAVGDDHASAAIFAGETPTLTVTAASGGEFTGESSLAWSDMAGAKPARGETPKATFTLTAAEGYAFDKTISILTGFSVTGATVDIAITDEGKTATVTITYPVVLQKIASDGIVVTTATAPATAGSEDAPELDASEEFEVGTTWSWTGIESGTDDSAWDAGDIPVAETILTAKEGYVFEGSYTVDISAVDTNGTDTVTAATVTPDSNDATKAKIKITYKTLS